MAGYLFDPGLEMDRGFRADLKNRRGSVLRGPSRSPDGRTTPEEKGGYGEHQKESRSSEKWSRAQP